MVTNFTIEDGLNLVEQQLKDAVAQLDNKERVDVKIAATIEGFRNSHTRGTLAIAPGRGNLEPKDRANTIIQDHDMIIDVFPFINFIEGRKHPSFYVDFVMDTMTGIELDVKRAKKKTYCLNWDTLGQDNLLWVFNVPVVLPQVRYEKEYLEKNS